ncbi:hypothetical protein NQ186_13320 [Pseudomonas zeae]|jgi:hypothetical protein|uniref:Uncharacterized protein n=1 Tax=Pseudomonas zeae TaxID=2745510 RepID=A0A9E6NKZ8_9PSED|nr:hypothetical protein [Pseudomonas zeae]MDX9678153.1 hypothetical protein [Pseudomonas zeae]QXI09656.1 hypothetical protein HU754_017610 [Pseudomonas zeae]UUT15107.1 hypothetical protein NQ186_13320 [Pseudomonas zeae]
MGVTRILDSEGELLNILHDLSALEWRKYGQRNPEVWMGDHFEREDRSRFPPYIAFRFEKESEYIISILNEVIGSYNGLISWVLMGRERYASSGMNWVIEPAYIKEVEAKAQSLGQSSGSYLAKYEPEFGSIAFEDLVGLTEYIRKKFSELNISANEL